MKYKFKSFIKCLWPEKTPLILYTDWYWCPAALYGICYQILLVTSHWKNSTCKAERRTDYKFLSQCLGMWGWIKMGSKGNVNTVFHKYMHEYKEMKNHQAVTKWQLGAFTKTPIPCIQFVKTYVIYIKLWVTQKHLLVLYSPRLGEKT